MNENNFLITYAQEGRGYELYTPTKDYYIIECEDLFPENIIIGDQVEIIEYDGVPTIYSRVLPTHYSYPLRIRDENEDPYIITFYDYDPESGVTTTEDLEVVGILSGYGDSILEQKTIFIGNAFLYRQEEGESDFSGGGDQPVEEKGGKNSIKALEGAALISFGRQNPDGVEENNYGIAINSSDDYLALPARAISLFQTNIDPTQSIKVSYNYQGILGTLPTTEQLGEGKVSDIYSQHMENTQGIFTDNMYIGDNQQYIAFYEDEEHKKHLEIVAADIFKKVQYYVLADPQPAVNTNVSNYYKYDTVNNQYIHCGLTEKAVAGVEYYEYTTDYTNIEDDGLKWIWENYDSSNEDVLPGIYLAGGEQNIDFDKTNPSTYGLNTFIDNNGFYIRDKDNIQLEVSRDGFIIRDNDDPSEKKIHINSKDGMRFFGKARYEVADQQPTSIEDDLYGFYIKISDDEYRQCKHSDTWESGVTYYVQVQDLVSQYVEDKVVLGNPDKKHIELQGSNGFYMNDEKNISGISETIVYFRTDESRINSTKFFVGNVDLVKTIHWIRRSNDHLSLMA